MVRNLRLTNRNGDVFRINILGSLQGRDAAQGLIALFNDNSVDDTRTVVPRVVDDTGITTPHEHLPMTNPMQQQIQKAPLQFAPLGALIVMAGIVVWSRR